MKDLHSIEGLEDRFRFEVCWHTQATRHAAEGLIGIASDGHAAAIVEVSCPRSVLKLAGMKCLLRPSQAFMMSLDTGDLAGTAHAQVNSETDFATKTEQFRSMVQSVAAAALSSEGI